MIANDPEQYSYRLKTLEEAQTVAHEIVTQLACHPRVYFGLLELLINAIEHGNLEISFESKSALLEAGKWFDELSKRLTQAPYASRSVTVTVTQSPRYFYIEIQDEGKGFDWLALDSMPLGSEQYKHGRGILIAKMISFDKVEYFGAGNRVVCSIRR